MRLLQITVFLFLAYSSSAQIFMTTNQALCYGDIGTVVVDSVRGIGTPTHYIVKPGNLFSTQKTINLLAGNYTMNVFDKDGNKVSDTFSILQPDTAFSIISLTSTPASCNPYTDGTATINIRGGKPPYSYSSSSSRGGFLSGKPINMSFTGAYWFYVNDANGCNDYSGPLKIDYDSIVRYDSATIVPALGCNNAGDGSVQFHSSVGAMDSLGAYSFSDASGFVSYRLYSFSNNYDSTNSTGYFSSLKMGTYNLSINGVLNCVNPNFQTSIFIRGNDRVYANASLEYGVSNFHTFSLNLNSTSIPCNKQTKINLLGGVPPYKAMLLDDLNQIVYQATDIRTFALNPATNVQYKFIVEDSIGCKSDTMLFSYAKNQPMIQIDSLTYPCNSENGNILNVSGIGGTQPYAYYLNESTGSVTGNFTGVGCGSNNIYMVDSVGCAVDTIIDFGCTGISANPISVTNHSCDSSGTIVMDTTNSAVSYLIEGSIIPYSNKGVFSNLSSGQYTITATDASSYCIASTKVFVGSSAPGVLLRSKRSTCKGKSDAVIFTEVTQQDSMNTIDSIAYRKINFGQLSAFEISKTDSVAGLEKGKYEVRIYFRNGCIYESNTNIGEGPTPTSSISLVVNENCYTGDMGIVAIGRNSFNLLDYSHDSLSWSSTPYFTGLKNGSVELYVREQIFTNLEQSYCVTKFDTTIGLIQNMKIDSMQIDHISCFYKDDGAIKFFNENLSYQLAPNQGDKIGSSAYANLPAGYYILEANKSNGCRADTDFYIEGAERITSEVNIRNTNEECYGAIDYIAGGGAGGFTYSLSSSQGNETAPGRFENLCEGQYELIAVDKNGCEQKETFVISQDATAPDNVFDDVIIYPNPTNDVVTISSDLLSNYNLSLFSMDGRLLLKKRVNNKKEKVSMSELPNGVYILKLKSFYDTKSFRVVVGR